MFRGLSLNAKMLIPSIVLSAVIAIIGFVGWRSLDTVSEGYNRVADVSVPKIHTTDQMFLSYRRIRISLRTLGLPGVPHDIEETSVKDVLAEVGNVDRFIEEYSKMKMEPGEKELLEKVTTAWADFKEVGVRVLKIHKAGGPEAAAKMTDIFFTDCPAAAKIFTVAITDLTTFHQKNAELWSKEADRQSETAQHWIIIAGCAGVFIGIALTIMTLRAVSGLIKSISTVADHLASGASKVSSVSDDVANASEVLSSSASQQAAALQQTTAAIEETSSMVQKNADNAKRSADISGTSQTSAERGKQAVGEVARSMDEIAASNAEIMAAVEESNREVSDIIKVINEIGSKTKVINEIVFQTKLLSFNASVEAARAGEQGKGFAVVAEEVGNLAQMSGKSAKEITDLLDSSVKRVQDIVDNMKSKVEKLITQGGEKVRAGTDTAQRCGEVLDEIVGQVSNVTAMASEISTASQEQSRGILEINSAITQLDSAAQQNSSASQNVAQSADELREEVSGLRTMIQQLNGLVKGDKAAAATAAAAPIVNNVRELPKKAPKAAHAPVVAAKSYRRASGDHGIPDANDPGFDS